VTPTLSTHRVRTNGWRRVRTGLLSVLLAGVAMAFAAPKPAHALSIEATFDPNLSASAVIVINTAISFYQTTFSDPITVNIEFENMNTGLGRSLTFVRTTPYSTYRTALGADATSANDATALANTPTGAFNPVTGSTFINVKNANLRAVGLPAAFGNFGTACVRVNYVGDSCIGLNVGRTTTGGGAFSLLATVEHEIDEALGLGSELPNLTFLGGHPAPEDLFRWASAGVRSFATNPNVAGCNNGAGAPAAFFSINGGVANLNQFNNCNNGDDYGDWITHTPSQVQDALTNGTGAPSLTAASSETVALDVIGYTFAVPEPMSLVLIATGLASLAAARRCARIVSRTRGYTARGRGPAVASVASGTRTAGV